MFRTLSELEQAVSHVSSRPNGTATITDQKGLQEKLIDTLIYTHVFTADQALKEKAAAHIQELARSFGAKPASIHTLYRAIGRGEVSGFTVPAMNIRTLTYDTARVVFRLAKELQIGPFIFEIARSEMGYTKQNPQEYAACILAAAIKEGHQGPVFIQGDHFQVKKKLFDAEPEKELSAIQALIAESLSASFYNIDIDASTIVDLSKEDLSEQQKSNYETTARLTKFIREHQPDGVTISIGGEIGHIGGKNSTVSDFEAFMEGYLARVGQLEGISKVSVQTGTSHGGVPLPDGTMQDVKLDFSVLSTIGAVAREKYHMGGAVQHGASTLPNTLFGEFVKAGTLEIHLATGFQNIIFSSMPQGLRSEMEQWTAANMTSERSPDMTDAQFIYKTRKKALGEFKKRLWDLADAEKQPIRDKLSEQFRFLFETLRIVNTRDIVHAYVS